MCEKDDFDEFARQQARGYTRRRFGQLGLSAGLGATLAAMLPGTAGAGAAAATPRGREVEIKTPDGITDAYFVHPPKGKHPAVLIWPDIFGLRPAFRSMADRLSEAGYAVLVVNPFYRTQRAPTAPEKADFSDPATRSALMALRNSLSPQTAATDARAFVAWLDQQAAVDTARKIGTTGYCMGGPLVMQTAAAVPARIGAGASFHGGGLATDSADSPHRLIPSMKAQFLIAVAENDDAKEPTVKDTLRAAFAQAQLPAEIEVYAGTQHGWCPPDSRVYDHAQAEKAWARLLALYQRAL